MTAKTSCQFLPEGKISPPEEIDEPKIPPASSSPSMM